MTATEAHMVLECISNRSYPHAWEILFPFLQTLTREQGRMLVLQADRFLEKGPSAKDEIIDQIWEKWK